jgi:hypothetical protein
MSAPVIKIEPNFPLGAAGSYVAVCGRSVATEAAIFDALFRAHFCQESLLFTSKVASNLARNLPRNLPRNRFNGKSGLNALYQSRVSRMTC